MNKLKVGSPIFTIFSSDGKANPDFYFLSKIAIVKSINKDRGEPFIFWGIGSLTQKSEEDFLKPNAEGMSYYLAELPNMDSYKVDFLYKVPTATLKKHINTYEAPWV